MWDTIGLSSAITPLTEGQLKSTNWTRTGTDEVHDNERGVTIFKTLARKSKDNKGIPYIRYTYKADDPTVAYLKVEVSMPTFLNGSNVNELVEGDIPKFFQLLRRYIAGELGIKLKNVPKSWTVTKLHACRNFDVGNNVQQYLQHLSQIQRPKYQNRVYKEVGGPKIETLEWHARGRKEKFYDKEVEIKKKKKYKGQKNHRKQAKGILRYEVELSRQELYAKDHQRRADVLLSKAFADEILEKGLMNYGISNKIQLSGLQNAYDIIVNSDIGNRQKTALVAMLHELHEYGEKQTKKRHPSSTYSRNIALLKEILGTEKLIFSPLELPPLTQIVSIQREKEKGLPM